VTGVWLGNDDNSPTRKATGGGLPVEVWTRFMRTAHQGVPVAALPNAQAGGFLSNLFHTASQASAAPLPPAPVPLAPIPSAGAYRPAPTRTSAPPAPPSPNARPEAAAGLDGWLVDRLFGR
jgi:penicillin-binding protein 1A